jgi:hypothetical protein
MVPTNLNDVRKARRNEVSAETLERFETEPDFLYRVITDDESWFFKETLKPRCTMWNDTHHILQDRRKLARGNEKSGKWSSFLFIIAEYFIKNLYHLVPP